MKGYNEMLRRIEPNKIICYSEPFPEMQGDIIYVDYELSGWKYLKGQSNALNGKIKSGRIIHKIMVQPDDILKGTGSAYGGKWKPKKPEDERFLGEPNTINSFYFKYRIDVKYGLDGRAEKERHYTDHGYDNKHSNPHDHIINWNNDLGYPDPQRPIDYFDNTPEFKSYKGKGEIIKMPGIRKNTVEENRFETISDFKWCCVFMAKLNFIGKVKLIALLTQMSGFALVKHVIKKMISTIIYLVTKNV